MNIHIPAIDFDKLLKIIVVIAISAYLLIGVIKNFDLGKMGKTINNIKKSFAMSDIYNYLDEHDNYYYKIENAVYCLSREQLLNSGEISQEFIDNMPNEYIEARYLSGNFELEYKDVCIER